MNRVAITGMGVVSPLGNDLELFGNRLLGGQSGIRHLTRFPAGALDSRIAGECEVENRTMKDIKVDFGLQAVEAAVRDANTEGSPVFDFYESVHCGISLGIGLELFEMKDMVRYAANGFSLPADAHDDPCFLQSPGDLCAYAVMKRYGLQRPPAVHVSACAASTDAIGYAFLQIRRGKNRMLIAGGIDSMVNPLGLAGFSKLQALSTSNDEPSKASRPFDLHRDGFVLGEGAGFLVLEEYASAAARGARIHGEIVGYGNGFDAYSVSDPHPEGLGACLAMQRALAMAEIEPGRISAINAHGTSTAKNDVMETIALKKVFEAYADKIPISATKSMIGHLISAAGAVELIASVVCGKKGMVHPTINLEHPDPQCDLDYVPNFSRCHPVEYVLSNSFAFGGQNSTLICRLIP